MACVYRGAIVATPVDGWSTTAAGAPTWHDTTALEQSAEIMALVKALSPDPALAELDERDREAARGVEVVEVVEVDDWFADHLEPPPSNRPPPVISDVVPALSADEPDEADTEPRVSDALIHEVRVRGLL